MQPLRSTTTGCGLDPKEECRVRSSSISTCTCREARQMTEEQKARKKADNKKTHDGPSSAAASRRQAAHAARSAQRAGRKVAQCGWAWCIPGTMRERSPPLHRGRPGGGAPRFGAPPARHCTATRAHRGQRPLHRAPAAVGILPRIVISNTHSRHSSHGPRRTAGVRIRTRIVGRRAISCGWAAGFVARGRSFVPSLE